MKLKLVRIMENNDTTFGNLYSIDKGMPTQICHILENSWKDNETDISCIPNGTYPVTKRPSEKLKGVGGYYIDDVPNRTGIMFHCGNTHHDTKGCLLTVLDFKRMFYYKGKPQEIGVPGGAYSHDAYEDFYEALRRGKNITLEIVSSY
jgi:hypothetical protein